MGLVKNELFFYFTESIHLLRKQTPGHASHITEVGCMILVFEGIFWIQRFIYLPNESVLTSFVLTKSPSVYFGIS